MKKRQIKRFARKTIVLVLVIFGISFLCATIYLNEMRSQLNGSERNMLLKLLNRNSAPRIELNYKGLQFDVDSIDGERRDWHDYAAMAADKKRVGYGEMGVPTTNKDESKKTLEKTMALQNGFNAFVSDMISVNRSVPDKRKAACRSKRYLAKLPTISVVIPCRNEYDSVLKRTMHSIVNRTPKELLKEIIIVDDASFRGYSIPVMEAYTNVNFPNLVKFISLSERSGLIKARVAGARIATGDVLVFFDSHIECGHNWLPPLLEPIAVDYRISTCPQIDSILHDTFEYRGGDNDGSRGGFNWDLSYQYMPLKLDSSADKTKPYKSPIMLGGLFAISRRFFWELGGYDEGLDIWGAEQFELSFKIWMCGGMLLDVPCSHVAHIFRGPWDNGPSPRKYNFVASNNKRVAEVWMDDYKSYLYEGDPAAYKDLNVGDLSHLHALRKQLHCKSFKWFLEVVAPDVLEIYPPVPPPDYANGGVKSLAYPNMCLDTINHSKGELVGVFSCASDFHNPQRNQKWRLTWRHEMENFRKNNCLDVYDQTPNASVHIIACHHGGGNQYWSYNPKTNFIMHGTKKDRCLEIGKDGNEWKLFVNKCNNENDKMKWTFAFINETALETEDFRT